MRTTSPRQYRDTPVDVKLVLCALWITTLFVFAYVDVFGFFRADVLRAALDGTGCRHVVEALLLGAIARTAWKWPPR